MNYFAHGRRFLDRPYFLAGVATPDWLSVVNRRVRARGAAARLFLTDPEDRLRELAAGIVRHHEDDRWFHRTRAFAELSLSLTSEVRRQLPEDRGFRTGFLGHILVELLLDAELIRREPQQLDVYYDSLAEVDPEWLGEAVSRISGKDARGLTLLLPRFLEVRFLEDYQEDASLWMRLNHVMDRVRLPRLPQSFCELLPAARSAVAARADELLTAP